MTRNFLGIDETTYDDGMFYKENCRLYYTRFFGDNTYISENYSKDLLPESPIGFLDLTEVLYLIYDSFKNDGEKLCEMI